MFDFRAALLALPLAFQGFAALAQEFPLTIEHAYGSTTIAAQPQRVLTWGWVAHDVVLDLGVVPVGLPKVSYGGDADGVSPWTREALDALGAELPPMLGEASGEVSLEAMLALDPDIILAPYSGLTEDEYSALSQFAPVIPFKTAAWQGNWQESVDVIGTALGLSERARTLIADTEALIASTAIEHPEIAGKSFLNFVNRNDGTISVRNSADPRTLLLVEAGLVSVAEDDTGSTGYTYSVSHENFAQLEADVLVAFLNTTEAAEAFFALPYIASAPHVTEGRVAVVDSEALTMAVGGAISPLSLRWGWPEFSTRLTAAAANAR
ncbi:ABC transporter substrate-binding protein [Pelagibacterium halotolerans]|uniref:Iron ABC transporter, substrate binding protein n=1 Tax=Pelagibacterium halotolerans (strain DSM 22347 / JCM 15775 / CGMCC 1.7692 / B2) TaxID=1082931 RepID=G4R8L9_PELHB|nr:ABC transporter substrate-binding protein [Pelagibacterium halotolerans]AEQ53424.1 iron ABC transporter, substrate binding protein [Pelagibacterium halotolerans B2]QJR20393.1 ABC transporter substrate-binding protein [Pelagibacterium halotolerans]SEA60665.1 iron complex transport system substrate-binding protein [Pelagibacterium halotolerans]